MCRHELAAWFCVVLGAANAGAQVPETSRPPQPAVSTNEQAIKLVGEAASKGTRLPAHELILAISRAQKPEFDLSSPGVRALKEAGVPDEAIVAMVHRKGDKVDNQMLAVLTAAAVGADELIRLVVEVSSERAGFDATTAGLARLRGAGVDGAVIRAVVRRLNPVLDPDEDPPVLAALSARITGGTVIGNAPFEVIRRDDGTPSSVRTQQFSQAATYLAFEAQPSWTWLRGTRGGGISAVTTSPIVNVRLTSIAVAEVAEVAPVDGDFLKVQKAVQFQFGGVIDAQPGRSGAG